MSREFGIFLKLKIASCDATMTRLLNDNMSTLDVDTVTRIAEEKPGVLKKLTVRDKDIDYIDDLSSDRSDDILN